MRPTLGRVVIYTRAPGEVFAATITRVEPLPDTLDALVLVLNDINVTDGQRATVADEHSYAVWLGVDIHHPDGRSHRWYTNGPIQFDRGQAPADHTWRWPPRA